MRVPEELSGFDELLRSRLDEYRYTHSLCVAHSARELALRYGANEDRAYLAGLLHDVMKNDPPDEQLKMIEKADIILSPCERANKTLWHAIAGEAFLRLGWLTQDEEILAAVRWHTTGCAGMTTLMKTVYLADFISPDRNYPDVGRVRRLADTSLEQAMIYTQRYSISKLLGDGRMVDPHSVECYNELIFERTKQ